MLRKVSQTTVATLATLVFVGITVSGAFAAWYVAAGYSSPQFIEGPFADYSDCNYAAAGYNERQPNWAFHCEARYSPSLSSLAASCSGTCFTLVYAAHDRDRVLAGPYPSLGPCQLEAANFRTLNDDVSPSTDGVDFSRYMCRPSYGVRV